MALNLRLWVLPKPAGSIDAEDRQLIILGWSRTSEEPSVTETAFKSFKIVRRARFEFKKI